MSFIFFYVFVLLSCLPLHHSVTESNISMNRCPESFGCSGVVTFKYPFYKDPDTRCGLIKVNCTSKRGEIQLGGRSYEITGKFDYEYKSNNDSYYTILIRNETFGRLVKNNNCEALMNNFTFISPSPLLYSISIFPYITLFKCSKNLTSAKQKDSYFDLHNYKRYTKCKDYNFYYNYFNGTVPSDPPHTCQVVRLPLTLSTSQGVDETNIFSLLNVIPSVFFKLSSLCQDCYRKGLRCDAKNGHDVQCSSAIKETHGKETTRIKIFAIAGSTLILMVSFIFFINWRRRKSNPFSYVSSKNKSPNLEDISLTCGLFVFSYKELEDATQNFDPSNELGDGGFGAVYYGKLQDGREVAVKKLHEHNFNRVKHFQNEVEILTKLRHPNLVVLYGCTSRQSQLLLVYEYVSNGTVADHLHGIQPNPTLLTWPIRLNIAIETARALVYLHASEIIHRDVKTNNILLDHNFCVKVADFGLSRFLLNNVTHVSTAPQGTPGYIDPQYYQCYQLTDKSDVYSFGVVLIELISSMVAIDLNRSQDEISLANLALKKIQGRKIDQLIDPILGSDMNTETMNMITSVAELAFQCLQYHSEMRPTMNEVFDVLMNIQAAGGVDAYDSTRDFQNVSVLPLSETNDGVVLLKNFRPTPNSVTSEWQSNSNSSASTKLSSNGDTLSMKNDQ